jgi:transcriptional repressor NrdR
MKCPFCEQIETKVIDSRLINESNKIRRRRKCNTCLKRFNTFEEIEHNYPMVVKSDGRRENFQKMKIYGGLKKACQKRPISTNQIDHIVSKLEKIALEYSGKEITAELIGEHMMNYLRILDPVAYIRFASVYRTFTDVSDFLSDIKKDECKFTPYTE